MHRSARVRPFLAIAVGVTRHDVRLGVAVRGGLTDPGNRRIVEVDGHGRPLREITGDGGAAGIVAVDPAGDLFTLDQRVIREYSPTGRPLGAWFSPYDANIVIDGAGNLFLVDQHITEITLPRG